MRPGRDIVAHGLRLAACLLMLAAAGVARTGKIGGMEIGRRGAGEQASREGGAVRVVADGVRVADSSGLEVGVTGYGGAVPVVVTVRDGRVESVAPVLPNQETALFFGLLDEAGLWHSWDEMTLEEAAAVEVDAVASATYSSRAAIANVKAALGALGEGAAEGKKGGRADWAPSAATVAALAVLVAAAVLPLFPRTRGKGWRTALLVLDVAVLGVWNGLFLSWTGCWVGRRRGCRGRRRTRRRRCCCWRWGFCIRWPGSRRTTACTCAPSGRARSWRRGCR